MQFHFLVSRYYVSNLFVVDAELYSQSFGIQETLTLCVSSYVLIWCYFFKLHMEMR